MLHRGGFEGVSRLVSFLTSKRDESRRDFSYKLLLAASAAEFVIPVFKAILEQVRRDELSEADISPAELEQVFNHAILRIREARNLGQQTLLDVAGVHFPPDGGVGNQFDLSVYQAWQLGARFATVGAIEKAQIQKLNEHGITVLARVSTPYNTYSYEAMTNARNGVIPVHHGTQNIFGQPGNEINLVEPYYDFYSQTLITIVPESEFEKHKVRLGLKGTYKEYVERLMQSFVEQNPLAMAIQLAEYKKIYPFYDPQLLLTPMAAGSPVDEYLTLEIMLRKFKEAMERVHNNNQSLNLEQFMRNNVALAVHPYTFAPFAPPLERFEKITAISKAIFGKPLDMYATEAGFLKGRGAPTPPLLAAAALLHQLSTPFNPNTHPIKSWNVWNLANTDRRIPGEDPTLMAEFDANALIAPGGLLTESYLVWRELARIFNTRKNLHDRTY